MPEREAYAGLRSRISVRCCTRMKEKMTVKIASIFIPAYVRPPYPGQTPEARPQRTVDKFERELLARVNGIVKYKPAERLSLDEARGGIVRDLTVRYDFEIDTAEPALAEVIQLALALFTLEQVTVYLDDTEAEDFDKDAADSLSIGAHDWSAA